MKIQLPKPEIQDRGSVRLGMGNVNDLRPGPLKITLPPKDVADRGAVRLGMAILTICVSLADLMPSGQEPALSFYRLIPIAPHPRRADRSAGGFLPLRGLRFCDPLTTATAYGWWVFRRWAFRSCGMAAWGCCGARRQWRMVSS